MCGSGKNPETGATRQRGTRISRGVTAHPEGQEGGPRGEGAEVIQMSSYGR